MRTRLPLLLIAAIVIGVGTYYVVRARATTLTLTGLVTTNDVIVSSQVAGQIGRLKVAEGDIVTKDQVLAVIVPDELRADSAYYASAAQGATSQVRQSEAALRFEEQQTDSQIHQAEASLAAAEAQQASASADRENAKLTVRARAEPSADPGSRRRSSSTSRARPTTRPRRASRRSRSRRTRRERRWRSRSPTPSRSRCDAASSPRASSSSRPRTRSADKADVRLGYTEVRAPRAGIVDVRAAREGEIVSPGQPIVTLVDPDDLWVRVDVEETYIDRIKLGDRLAIRLPSGAELDGTVFYRSVDAGFATQRDVSRIKRDIKTFEIRLRVDNHDRRLAVGMTAYVCCRSDPEGAMYAIQVRDIVKRFGEFTAVKGVSFDVQEGEVFGLLGPNGAGKSTLIRMLTTLIQPTAGGATVNGFDVVRQANDVRRSIGVIPQAMTSDQELSVRENLLIYAKLYSVPQASGAIG